MSFVSKYRSNLFKLAISEPLMNRALKLLSFGLTPKEAIKTLVEHGENYEDALLAVQTAKIRAKDILDHREGKSPKSELLPLSRKDKGETIFDKAAGARKLESVNVSHKQLRRAKNLLDYYGSPESAIERMIEKGSSREVAEAAVNEALKLSETDESFGPLPSASSVNEALKDDRSFGPPPSASSVTSPSAKEPSTTKAPPPAARSKRLATFVNVNDKQLRRAKNLLDYYGFPEPAIRRMVEKGSPIEVAEAAVNEALKLSSVDDKEIEKIVNEIDEAFGEGHSLFEKAPTFGPPPSASSVNKALKLDGPELEDDILWAGEGGEPSYIEGIDPDTGKPFKEEFQWGAPGNWNPEGDPDDWRDIIMPAKRPYPYNVAEQIPNIEKKSGFWSWLWGNQATTTEAAKEVIATIEQYVTPLVEKLDNAKETGDKGDYAWRDIRNITSIASKWKPILENLSEKRASRLNSIMKFANEEESENIVENVESDFADCLMDMNSRLGNAMPNEKVLSLINEAKKLLVRVKDMAKRGRNEAAANLAIDVLRICDEIDGMDPVKYELIPMVKNHEGVYKEVPDEEMEKIREIVKSRKDRRNYEEDISDKFKGRFKGTLGDIVEKGKGKAASKFRSNLFKMAIG